MSLSRGGTELDGLLECLLEQQGSGWFRKVFFFFLHSWILSLVGREFWGGEGEFACKSPGPGVG